MPFMFYFFVPATGCSFAPEELQVQYQPFISPHLNPWNVEPDVSVMIARLSRCSGFEGGGNGGSGVHDSLFEGTPRSPTRRLTRRRLL